MQSKTKYVDSKCNSQDVDTSFNGVHGILVPGGFGERGTEGKIAAIRYARENKIPFFGICLGMQMAVVEFSRSILGWKDANSREFDGNSSHCVIDLMNEQRQITDKGGTMRLGAYPCVLLKGSKARKIYQSTEIMERHRHRYEVNPNFIGELEAAGLVISGRSPDRTLVEMVELPDHPYFAVVSFTRIN